MPVTIGESSPAVTATIASSRRASPSAHATCLDQHVSLNMGRERESVGMAEAGGHRGRFGGDRCRRHEVARRLVLERELA